VISGGSSDLKAKAKKWDENSVRKLKERRVQLQDELRQLHLNAKRELDVEMKRNQITQMEARLRFTQQEIRKLENGVQQQEADYDSASNEPEQIEVSECHLSYLMSNNYVFAVFRPKWAAGILRLSSARRKSRSWCRKRAKSRTNCSPTFVSKLASRTSGNQKFTQE
jgi:hypothetical protein